MLDQGVVVPGWQRTGFEFKSWLPGIGFRRRGMPVLRHARASARTRTSSPIDANECAMVRANPDWTFEGLAFKAHRRSTWRSARPTVPVVWRLYNNGMGGQANHRYLTSRSEIGDMIGRGWLLEGPVFCTPS